MGRLTIVYIFAAAAVAALASTAVTHCTQRDAGADNAAASVRAEGAQTLAGRKFRTAHQNGTPITLEFAAEGYSFHGRVVNNFRGSYSIDGNNIKFGQTATTMMMGLPDAMTAEQDFFRFLEAADRFEISGDTLTLHAGGKTMVFEKAE
ncbi:MAG: META domain-containing protein [Alphaproteobacteria bacterium]|nr:META domain-containing protein [Alphaproteobacteria bacterium]